MVEMIIIPLQRESVDKIIVRRINRIKHVDATA
jgi:hypothetical protein